MPDEIRVWGVGVPTHRYPAHWRADWHPGYFRERVSGQGVCWFCGQSGRVVAMGVTGNYSICAACLALAQAALSQ